MFKIKLYNKIAAVGLKELSSENYTCSESIDNYDAILVRSADLHEVEFPPELKAIARAGAGTNNIPVDKCSEKGIVVFNTPGANANAVKELAIAALILSSRKITDGILWAKTLSGDAAAQIEKGKSAFAGPEILGKKLGVVGLGAIGVMVANAATNLGMDVIGYDPYLSIDSAWELSRRVGKAANLAEIFEQCDYITLHVPLNDDTKWMVNAASIASMKNGARIINLSRGGLVNNADMASALESGKVACYVTDFPDEQVIAMKNTICIPHLGASTPESEDNCAIYACRELRDYLKNGSIINSVNFPSLCLGPTSHRRICVIHKNVPNVLAQLTKIISANGINIENMYNQSKKAYAYTVFEVESCSPDIHEKLATVPEVVRTRLI